jgi:hypothetical protein
LESVAFLRSSEKDVYYRIDSMNCEALLVAIVRAVCAGGYSRIIVKRKRKTGQSKKII